MGKSDVFSGCTFCVSGHFTISQSAMQELVVRNGGHIAKSVTKQCTHLVCDQMGSAKTAKAEKDGIAIVTEDWVNQSIEEGKMSTDASLFLSGAPSSNGKKASGGGGATKTKKKASAKDEDEDEEDEEEEEEEEEEEKPKKKKAAAPAAKKAAKGGDVFAGEVFCVSGKFSISQGAMQDLIARNGGSCVATPNKNCTYLVADSIGSSKTQKAIADGIDIVTEAWVNKSIEEGKKSTDKKLFLSGGGVDADADADDDDDGADDGEEEDEEEEKPKKKAPAKKAAPAKRKGKAAKNDEDDAEDDAGDDEDDADDEPASKKSKSTASTGSSDTAKIKTVVVKGAAPVDDMCPKHSSCRVYVNGSNIYDAMLNQTNIAGNNNKFYIIQVLESEASPKTYYCWNRWGRVGATGQNALEACGSDAARAVASFEKKFMDKTKNRWAERANFKTYSGKYTLIERDYSGDADDDDAASTAGGDEDKPKDDSKLDKRTQELIKLICDLKMMKDQMTEIGYDANKMPLGKLSKEHIRKGYAVLQEISAAINNGQRRQLTELSSQFYTLIPHIVGMRPPPVIGDVKILKEKLTLCESLEDASIATKLLRADSNASSTVNPIDLHYQRLKCEFTPLAHTSKEFEMVREYAKNTHGSTHRQYSLDVLEVFALDREGEMARFNNAGFDKVKNTQLLWHGSRLTNFVGIISQGLRIAPPEAPVTGYMFGKGVYFADMISKSANYCMATRGNNIACMLLCEVALGDMNELTQADYHASNLPAGKLSTKGLGRSYPDPAGARTLENGTIVPMGTEVKGTRTDLSLLYNEYIVYDVAQIKCKYLVKLKFNHH